MTPVLQTRFKRGEGNCLNACVASILGMPLGDGGVPEGRDDLRPWLAERDLGLVWVTRIPGAVMLAGCGSYYIGSGESPRDAGIDHAIVMSDSQEVHDPHPSGLFVRGHLKQIGFIVRMGITEARC